MDIYFATNNAHKVSEIRAQLPVGYTLYDLKDVGLDEDIPETGATLQDNALQKADFLADKFPGKMVIADDTGLEVEALNGAPGLMSARYAGPECLPADNIAKLLDVLEGVINRKAVFRTVICHISKGGHRFFEGIVQGKITQSPSGSGGFGYDPVFMPEGYAQTFGQLSPEIKNGISHRALAVKALVNYLNRLASH